MLVSLCGQDKDLDLAHSITEAVHNQLTKALIMDISIFMLIGFYAAWFLCAGMLMSSASIQCWNICKK